jgi:hypothetical protein
MALIVTGDDEVTPSELTVNVADVTLDGTVTVAGTVAFSGSPLVRVTTTPLGPAFPVKVAVPVEGVPEITVVGFKATEVRAAGLIVREAVFVTPLLMAVTVTTA